MGYDDRRVQKFTFVGGLLGLVGGFALCYWTSVIDYPLNIGGRPLNSWPAFAIPTYETTILLAALSTVGGMLALNGLPQPYHPHVQRAGVPREGQQHRLLPVRRSRPTRGSTPRGTGSSSRGWGRMAVSEVERVSRGRRDRTPSEGSRRRRLRARGARLVLAGPSCCRGRRWPGCRQDMHDRRATRRSKPTTSSPTSAPCGRSRRHGRARHAARRRPLLHGPSATANSAGAAAPGAVDHALLERGQERFNIYCAPCHSQLGDGNGMVVQRGYKRPVSFHDQRLRDEARSATSPTSSRTASARCRATRRIRARPTAGRSPPTSGPCSRARAPTLDDVPPAHRPALERARVTAPAPGASHEGGPAHDLIPSSEPKTSRCRPASRALQRVGLGVGAPRSASPRSSASSTNADQFYRSYLLGLLLRAEPAASAAWRC